MSELMDAKEIAARYKGETVRGWKGGKLCTLLGEDGAGRLKVTRQDSDTLVILPPDRFLWPDQPLGEELYYNEYARGPSPSIERPRTDLVDKWVKVVKPPDVGEWPKWTPLLENFAGQIYQIDKASDQGHFILKGYVWEFNSRWLVVVPPPLVGTATGRTSCTAPNLANPPRDLKEAADKAAWNDLLKRACALAAGIVPGYLPTRREVAARQAWCFEAAAAPFHVLVYAARLLFSDLSDRHTPGTGQLYSAAAFLRAALPLVGKAETCPAVQSFPVAVPGGTLYLKVYS